MGDRPDPEATANDSKGFDFEEASAGFRASWEDDPAAPAAPKPAPEVAAPTQVGLGPVAPPLAAAEPAPAPVPEQPAPPVVAIPMQPLDPPKPIEAAPEVAVASPAGSAAMKKTMLGIGNPLVSAAGSPAGASGAVPAHMQRTMIGLAPVEPNPMAAPSTLVVHEPTPPPRSNPVASTGPLPSVVVKESERPPPPAPPAPSPPKAESVWDDPRPGGVPAQPAGFDAPARRNEAFVSDEEIAALGPRKSRGVVFAILGAAAILLAAVGVKVLLDRGDGEAADARVTAVPVKPADPAPEPTTTPPPPAPAPEATSAPASATAPTPTAESSAAPEEPEPEAEPAPPPVAAAPRQAKRRAPPPPRKPAPIAKKPRPVSKPTEEPAPPKAGSGAIVRETPF